MSKTVSTGTTGDGYDVRERDNVGDSPQRQQIARVCRKLGAVGNCGRYLNLSGVVTSQSATQSQCTHRFRDFPSM